MSNIDEAAAMSGSAAPARDSQEAAQALPDAKFVFNRAEAALVVIDPQNDFLSPDEPDGQFSVTASPRTRWSRISRGCSKRLSPAT